MVMSSFVSPTPLAYYLKSVQFKVSILVASIVDLLLALLHSANRHLLKKSRERTIYGTTQEHRAILAPRRISTTADKANLRRKCRNNFKLEEGILYYRRNVLNENEPWRICVHTEDEKKRVLESCHSGVEG